MESYEVIIIGAGPAGLNCALKLAQANKKVLLLEKNQEIGPKVCAGGLTGHDLSYLKLPEELLDFKFDEIIIYTPHQKDIIKLVQPFIYTLDRKNFGQWQLNKLKKNNTVIKTNARVTEINNNYVIVNKTEKISFKHLVGADGASSIVRRHLGLKTKDLVMAIQYIVPTNKYKKLEIFLDSELFHSGYAWIFPHKNYVSIGCCCDRQDLSSKKLRENFNQWLKNNSIDISNGKFQAHPINFDYQGHQFKNIFLVGGAAGFSSGLTGEGIYQALISGEEVAKTILDKNYVSKKIEKLLKTKKIHENLLHFFEKSGKLRKIEYESLALLLKFKFIDKKMIDLFI